MPQEIKMDLWHGDGGEGGKENSNLVIFANFCWKRETRMQAILDDPMVLFPFFLFLNKDCSYPYPISLLEVISVQTPKSLAHLLRGLPLSYSN